MKTVTSVSGGRTSSYMALNFPTQYNIFSLVRIEDPLCAPKDKKLIQYVEDKIQMPFIATAESDKTLYVLQQLEQDLGKAIVWVSGDTFEQVIKRKSNMLPNRRQRWCTTEMKMVPIFWWCYLNLLEDLEDQVFMNIGYRSDEPRRTTDDLFDYPISCNNFGNKRQNWVKGFEWRTCKTPLKTAGISNPIIKEFFINKLKYDFPVYSNCVGCMNKTEIEIQEQFYYEPEKMNWFNNQEKLGGNRFNMHITLEEIKNRKYTPEQILMMESFATCNCTD